MCNIALFFSEKVSKLCMFWDPWNLDLPVFLLGMPFSKCHAFENCQVLTNQGGLTWALQSDLHASFTLTVYVAILSHCVVRLLSRWFNCLSHSADYGSLSLFPLSLYIKYRLHIYNGASQVALVVKTLPANAGDVRDEASIPGWGRSSGGRNGTPLQYSCLENPMDRGAWWATVHMVPTSGAQLSIWAHIQCNYLHESRGHVEWTNEKNQLFSKKI